MRFYLSLLIITCPSPHFLLVLVSFSPAQVCVFILVFVFSFAHVRTFYLPLLFIHPPKYAVFIFLLQFVIDAVSDLMHN